VVAAAAHREHGCAHFLALPSWVEQSLAHLSAGVAHLQLALSSTHYCCYYRVRSL
jgi:hypothetical protein